MKPGVKPENATEETKPPMVTWGTFSVGDKLVEDAATPLAGVFETGPSPVMYSTTYLPRAAGFAAVAMAPVRAWVAPLDALSRMKMPGCAPSTGTVCGVDEPADVVTTTCAELTPESDHGAWTLNCSDPFEFST